MSNEILKIGTSGFLFPDWRGSVYPKKLQPEDTLYYYNDELGFDSVEINATYYNLLSVQAFENMERNTKKDFEFVVKAFRGITHNYFDPDLVKYKPTLPQVNEFIDKFIYSIKPLEEKKKLGAVLLQFPVYFKPENETRNYILMCKEKFSKIPLVIEFRNSLWSTQETWGFLKANKLSNCVVDEPKLPKLMPFVNEFTGDPAYFRFHGRNPRWFSSTREERYNYLYSDDELNSFVPEIKKAQSKANRTYIFFNNCHGGSALKNALRLKEILGFNLKEGKLF